MIDAIFDDTADREKDWEKTAKLSDIILRGCHPENQIEIFLLDLWRHINSELKNLPAYKYYKTLFHFDLIQMINSMYYSCLINQNLHLLNFTENRIHTAPNMIIYLYIDVDLMASPSFDRNELGRLREMLWYVQQMARIGNWITTWKRELKERDFSSGVFAYAISNDILRSGELRKLDESEIISRIESSRVIEQLFKIWKENQQKALSISENLKSVDGLAFLKGFENLMKFHLASEGFK